MQLNIKQLINIMIIFFVIELVCITESSILAEGLMRNIAQSTTPQHSKTMYFTVHTHSACRIILGYSLSLHRGKSGAAGTKRGQFLEVKAERYKQPVILKLNLRGGQDLSTSEIGLTELIQWLKCSANHVSMVAPAQCGAYQLF